MGFARVYRVYTVDSHGFMGYAVEDLQGPCLRAPAGEDHMTNSLAGNKTLSFGSASSLQRSVIVMDECDGMTGGDKGGVQAPRAENEDVNMQKPCKNRQNRLFHPVSTGFSVV